MKPYKVTILMLFCFFLVRLAFGQSMIKRSSFGISGTSLQSNSFRVIGTVGQAFIGKNINTSYVNESGFLASAKLILAKDEIFETLPKKFELFQNYPNPFNPATNIRFSIPEATHVRLDVYNVLGQRVAILIDSKMEPGYQVVKFDAGNLASGFYIYRFQAGDFISFKKMILLE